jgi:hypothetical protein
VPPANPVAAYAPIVFLHTAEDDWPTSAERYISQSELRWSHDDFITQCDHTVWARGNVNTGTLGSGGYTHNSECDHSGPLYRSNQFTRPRDGDSVFGGAPEGFYLEPDGEFPDAFPVPVYYEYQPRSYIRYWFFYPFSDNRESFDHQGDWEHVDVRLDAASQATHVAYFQHGGGPCILPWDQVISEGRRPLVFSGKGSHASYPRPDADGRDLAGPGGGDETDHGPRWDTGQILVPVQGTGWYGYGGAWGVVGADSPGLPADATTGPLGPSTYKTQKEPVPTTWAAHCEHP